MPPGSRIPKSCIVGKRPQKTAATALTALKDSTPGFLPVQLSSWIGSRLAGDGGSLIHTPPYPAQCLRTKPEIRMVPFYVVFGSVFSISILSDGAAIALTISTGPLDACRRTRSIASPKLHSSARRVLSPCYSHSFRAEGPCHISLSRLLPLAC